MIEFYKLVEVLYRKDATIDANGYGVFLPGT
jgi:hypothetical protein